MKIRRGDTVKILYGKDAGTTGKVIRVMRKSAKVVIEGKNAYKRHLKGDGKNRKSEIVSIFKPMHVSKVQLISDGGKPTRVGFKVEGDKKVRFAKRDGKIIDSAEGSKKETKKTVANGDKKEKTGKKPAKKKSSAKVIKSK